MDELPRLGGNTCASEPPVGKRSRIRAFGHERSPCVHCRATEPRIVNSSDGRSQRSWVFFVATRTGGPTARSIRWAPTRALGLATEPRWESRAPRRPRSRTTATWGGPRGYRHRITPSSPRLRAESANRWRKDTACSASIVACCGKVMPEKRGDEATEKDGALDKVAEVLLRHGGPPEIWQQGRPDGTRHCSVLGNFSRSGNPCSAI